MYEENEKLVAELNEQYRERYVCLLAVFRGLARAQGKDGGRVKSNTTSKALANELYIGRWGAPALML